MERVLRLLGSRYVLALILIVGIAAVVAIGKTLGATPAASGVTAGAPSAMPTAIASGHEDDGLAAPPSPPAPSTSPGATPPDALATRFVTAWLHHTDVTPAAWHAGLAPYMTAKLSGELTGVDPAGVPATRTTGPITIIRHDSAYVDATIPVDTGVVTLRLLATNGRWLVDGVSWTRT